MRIAEKTRSPPTEFEEQPTDREQTCQILDALQSIQPDAIDSEYAEANLFHLPNQPSWISREMHQYWSKQYGIHDPEHQIHFLNRSGIDVLVYCSADSQLTHQANCLGLNAKRFGLKEGDLSTLAGRIRLYDMLRNLRPSQIWVSPRCGPWSNWNRLNIDTSKSSALAEQILADRKSENVHLQLCSALCMFQVRRGPQYHFHLEQPQGSELAYQKEIVVFHHPCVV